MTLNVQITITPKGRVLSKAVVVSSHSHAGSTIKRLVTDGYIRAFLGSRARTREWTLRYCISSGYGVRSGVTGRSRHSLGRDTGNLQNLAFRFMSFHVTWVVLRLL
jgi:hypothetical protein